MNANSMIALWRRHGYWLKLATSLSLLAIVFMRIDTPSLLSSFDNVPWWYFVVGSVLFALTQVATAVRWWLLTANIRLRQVLLMTFGTQHLIFILPSSVTIDALRLAFLRRQGEKLEERIGSVIVDRALSMLVLSASIGFCLTVDGMSSHSVFGGLELGVALAFISMTALVFIQTQRGVSWIRSSLILLSKSKVIGRFEHIVSVTSLSDCVCDLLKRRSLLFLNVLLAFSMHLLAGLALQVLGVVWHFQMSFLDYLTIITLMQLLTLLPISIGGIGLREVSLVGLVGLYGVPTQQAVVASITPYPIVVLFAVLGWLISTNVVRLEGVASKSTTLPDNLANRP